MLTTLFQLGIIERDSHGQTHKVPIMRSFNTSRTIVVLGALGGVLAVAGLIWLLNQKKPERGPTGNRLFHECAQESGLTFRMTYLEGEQGERFKINLYDHGCGVAVGDYDGDGYDDIYFVNQFGPNGLFRNKGDGTFEDVTKEAGVALDDRVCVSATFIDYDNDGRQDLFITSTRQGNVLFHNEGNGKFRDVTAEVGLHHVGHSNSAHFFDFDNDGHLDLLVTNTAKWTLTALEPKPRYYPGKLNIGELMGSEREFNILYRNDGKGKFVDVTEQSGLKGLGWAADVAVFDFDGDGFLDVAITNMFGRAQLYRNKRNGTFVEVTKEVLGRTSCGGMGIHAFDFNNDGKLDLFMVDMHSDMWMDPSYNLAKIEPRAKYKYPGGPFNEDSPGYPEYMKRQREVIALAGLRLDEVIFGNTFFKNLGNGKFVEMSDKANLETFWPWGIACGDFDNDGLVDLFITAGMGYPFGYWPNSLMMNNGDESFTDRAEELGVEPPNGGVYLEEKIGGQLAPRSSRAAAVADFNHDGRLDIVCNNFNGPPYYFKNVGKSGNYLALKLTGTTSNRDAIGAVVRIYTGNEILTRQVNCACGYLAQSSKVLHFGLGSRTQIDKIEITWPRGKRQTISSLALNTLHPITEPRD